MAGLIPLGRIAAAGEDIFPTTAPHLDVRVIPQFGPQKGKNIDPQTARTLLQNIVVGENRTPLVQQQGDQWKWNYDITSPFGQRKAPVPGASTYHRGIDLSIDPQNIAYKGTGTYTPGEGFGTLKTTDPQGNPYEIQLLHTKPGKQASIAPQVESKAPPKEERDARTEDILKAFLYGTGMQGEKPKTLQQQLKEQIIGGAISQALNPPSFLSSYAATSPMMPNFSQLLG